MIKKGFYLGFMSFNLCIYADYFVPEQNMHLVNRALMKEGNYYDITINGKHYVGDRIWKERWDILKDAVDYTDKKVLDLGTFMGFVPTFTLKYGGAKEATGIDYNSLQNAKKVAKAFEVPSRLLELDMDRDNYEEILGYDYDIVFCMSTYHWVKKKEKLLAYLSNFDHIIYEGHDDDETELKRFIPLGYHYKKLGVSYSGKHQYTSRGRTMFYLYRD